MNDVHFGEVEAGRIDDHEIGPVQRPEPGEPPFPETMNRAAVAEMVEADLAAVIVKGDLTAYGTDAEFEAFERCYRPAFGDRLAVVRGNHDAYLAQTVYAGDRRIDLPGVTVALIDTTIPEHTTGRITAETLAFLDDVAQGADRPVMVMGHHQQWVGGNRAADYFGINPDDSEALTELIARRPSIVAYTAGHTHRHRVRALHGRGRRAEHRGRLREGLPRHLGGVPGVRRRDHAGRPPGVVAGRPPVERTVPPPLPRLRHRLRDLRARPARRPLLRDRAAELIGC